MPRKIHGYGPCDSDDKDDEFSETERNFTNVFANLLRER